MVVSVGVIYVPVNLGHTTALEHGTAVPGVEPSPAVHHYSPRLFATDLTQYIARGFRRRSACAENVYVRRMSLGVGPCCFGTICRLSNAYVLNIHFTY